MKNAQETIINIIKNKIWHMNKIMNNPEYAECFERYRHEVHGMLICLKNISEDDRFYNINFWEDRIEFGYYDNDHRWIEIK